MIKRLELKNIALIEHAIIDFEKGLNVLSGETGSGKSVIVDSINFVLGAKADKSMIRHGENECFASVVFDVLSNQSARDVLEDLIGEVEDEVIVSRKFTIDSKSVIRVNGIPFTLSMLRAVTSTLVDVHGQSEHYSLMKKSEQLKVLDRFSDKDLALLKSENKQIVCELKEIDRRLKGFGGSESERAIRADVLKYQIEEIESVDIQENEEDELLIRKKTLQNAEKIAESLNSVKSAIYGEGCISDMLGEAIRYFNQISSLSDTYSLLAERLKSASVELSDIADTADDYLSDVEFNEGEADRIEKRLDQIKTVKKKYGATVQEIQEFLSNARVEYEKLVNFDVEYAKLTDKKAKLIEKLNAVYAKISSVRKACANDFSKKVLSQLTSLGMKDASFTVEFEDLEKVVDAPYAENGNDVLEFGFSANLGEPVKPLSKIISGGEMSRFMLALKAIICEYQEISTYIFDEIDVGISGKTAETVAEKFADISKSIQVIAISHLPQICAFSDVSFAIEKFTEENKTHTKINKLSNERKISEIVRIIGGTDESEVAILHAKEMIAVANAYKSK